jgi:hypothetical protein
MLRWLTLGASGLEPVLVNLRLADEFLELFDG